MPDHPPPSLRLARAARRSLLPLLLAAATLPAQSPRSDSAAARARAAEPLFTRRDAFVAAGFAAATVALLPLDRRVAIRLQDSTTQANHFLHHSATGVELIASPGAYVIGGGLYAVGRLAHVPRAADLGLHGTEAVLLADVVTGVLKGATGRARPFVVGDTNPHDFRFGRGFTHTGGYTSFPSGHTTTAFAAAAAVTSETSRWWPRSTWVVAPVMYGGATLVGLSRMYHNKHWASDVALGAGIGTFSGLKVVRYNHAHPGNRVDRWLLGPTVAPAADGSARLMWTVPWPRAGAPPDRS
jgi:membrane-associated phospholipid phosphatase